MFYVGTYLLGDQSKNLKNLNITHKFFKTPIETRTSKKNVVGSKIIVG